MKNVNISYINMNYNLQMNVNNPSLVKWLKIFIPKNWRKRSRSVIESEEKQVK